MLLMTAIVVPIKYGVQGDVKHKLPVNAQGNIS